MVEMLQTKEGKQNKRKAETESDLIGMYLREIGVISLLSAQDEKELAQEIEKGKRAEWLLNVAEEKGLLFTPEDEERLVQDLIKGEEAKERFINANLKLVIRHAASHYFGISSNLGFADLIQEGNLGIIRAVEKFDWRKGYKFSTYATDWINQSINRAIANKGRTIRLPVHVSERASALRRIKQKLREESGEEPSLSVIAEKLGISPAEVTEIERSVSIEPISFDMPVDKEGNITLGEIIRDEKEDPEKEASQNLLREDLIEFLKEVLDPRELKVIFYRFRLFDGRKWTLEEVGREFGVTRERIRQIEVQALKKLQESPKKTRLKDYFDSS